MYTLVWLFLGGKSQYASVWLFSCEIEPTVLIVSVKKSGTLQYDFSFFCPQKIDKKWLIGGKKINSQYYNCFWLRKFE